MMEDKNQKQETHWVILHLSASEAWVGRVSTQWCYENSYCSLVDAFVMETASAPVVTSQGPAMFRNTTITMPHLFLHPVELCIPREQIRATTFFSELAPSDRVHLLQLIEDAREQALQGRAKRSGIALGKP